MVEFKMHKVEIRVWLSWSKFAFEAFEDGKSICFGDGYMSWELAYRAAARELDYRYRNRWMEA